jgi:Tol biopolymer transport system component
MSPDGKVIAFAAHARLQDINSPNTYSNVFVRFMETDTLRAMPLPEPLKTNLFSVATKVSPRGSQVAVTTYARVSGTNQPRLFIWDLPTDTVGEIDLAPYGPLEGGSVQTYFVDDGVLYLGSTSNSVFGSVSINPALSIFIDSFNCTLLSASADGNVIAFATPDALVPGDLNNEPDVYVDDDNTDTIELISTAHPRWRRPLPDMSIHHLQNAHSTTDKIAFTSFSDALVANDTNGFADIFTWSKSSNQVRLESTALNGEGANGHSSDPTLSRDGHWLAFISAASNLVANDTNHMEDVFLKSLDDGSIIRVSESVRPSTIKLLGVRAPILGNDGRFVAYTSTRSDMTMTNITSTTGAAYLFDRSTGENLWIGAGLGTLPQQPVAIYAPNVYFFVRTNLYVFNAETGERTLIGPANTDPAFTSDGSLLALQLNISANSQIYTYDPATLLTNVVLSFDQAGTIRSDPMSISDTKLVSFLSATALAAPDLDTTNDVYTVSANTPSPVRLVTTPQSLPLGSGALLPRNAVLSRDATLLYYLATTNSPIDATPRTQLMIAEVKSGITTAVTATADGGLAPFISTKPILLSTGVATVTTARGVFDSPVDKGNLVYSTDGPDADGDGFPDFWEWQFFNNLNQTAGGDADADSMSNIDEILAGTNPTDAASVVSLTVQDFGSYLLLYVRAPAQPITLEFTDDLSTNNWLPLGVGPYIQNGLTVFQVNNESGSRFFRIQVVTP